MTSTPQNKILRVGIIQSGKIIEERLLRKRENVTIGQGPKNTFVVPSNKLPRSMVLFRLRGPSYHLSFDREMSGKISLGDAATVADLPSLVASGKAQRRGDRYEFELNERSRGKVKLGDITLLFQFVPPPLPPPRLNLPPMRGSFWKSLDRDLAFFLVFSAVVQLGSVTAISLHDWPVPKRQVKPTRAVVRLQMSPKTLKPPKEAASQEGEGAGKADAQKTADKSQTVKARPTRPPTPEEIAAAAEARKAKMVAEVRNKTLLKFMGGRKGAAGEEGPSLLATITGGKLSDDAFSGSVAMAMVGTGQGGSPEGRRYLEGIEGAGGKVGTVEVKAMKRVGGTVAAASEGEQKVERRVNAEIKISNPNVTGTGTIDQNQIADVVRRRLGAVKSCYERELKKDPTLQGKITIQFTINERGRVVDAMAVENAMNSPAMEQCIIARLQGWKFPEPEGGSVTVRYPFVFLPSS